MSEIPEIFLAPLLLFSALPVLRGDKRINASRNGNDKPMLVFAFARSLSERGDMNRQIILFDKQIYPSFVEQTFFDKPAP